MGFYTLERKGWIGVAVLAAALAGLTACGPAQVETKTIPADKEEAALGKASANTADKVKPKPPLQFPLDPITIEQTEAKVLPPITLQTVAQYSDGDAWYFQLALPKEIREKGLFDSYEPPRPRHSWEAPQRHFFESLTPCYWSKVEGRPALLTPQEFFSHPDLPGGVPPQNEKGVEASTDLFLRVDGKEKFAKNTLLTLTVHGCDMQGTMLKAGAIREIRIDLTRAKTGKKNLQRNFRTGISRWFEFMSFEEKFSHFTTFAFHRLSALAGKTLSKKETLARKERHKNELNEMMDFYTGHSSVREAMAMDNGLGAIPTKEKTQVALNSIEGVAKQSRDYAGLLKAAGKTGFKLDPLSQYLPADTLIATFSGLGEFAKLTRVLDEKLGDMARIAESAAGPSLLKERYGAQLAMEFSGMAELLGDLAAGTTSLVLGDPYLREGTDVSLVFLNRNKSLLEEALATHAQKAGKIHGGITTQKINLAGFEVHHITSQDGVVNRFQIQLNEVTIVSNSKGGMNRLLQVYKGKHPSMAQTADYQYARGIVPWSPSQESGFVYVGDELVAALTSPHAKIAESRRMRERERLMAVNYAALLFGWMKGRPPTSQDELLDSPWLTQKDLRHHDGRAITWSPKRGASSDWGTASQLTPVIDMPFDKVSENERDAYIAFRDQYNRSWQGNLDPALLRVKRHSGTNNLDMRVHILPLSPNGDSADAYRKIREVAGDTRVISTRDIHGTTATLALGKDSFLKRMGDNYLGMFVGEYFGLGLLGDWIEVGLWESAEFQKLAREYYSSLMKIQTDGSIPQRDNHFGSKSDYQVLLPRLPLFAGIKIGNPLVFAGMLAMARAAIFKSADGLIKWAPVDPYGDIPVTRITVAPSSWTHDTPTELYYAVGGGAFYLSLQRDVLEAQLDRAQNGQLPSTVSTGDAPNKEKRDETAQLSSIVAPSDNGWMVELATMSLIKWGFNSHQNAVFGRMILERGLGTAAKDPSTLKATAITSLGYYPQSPYGGEFSIDANQMVSHPYLGSQLAPRLLSSFRETAMGTALRSILNGLFTVSSYDRGNEVELVTTAKIRFRE